VLELDLYGGSPGPSDPPVESGVADTSGFHDTEAGLVHQGVVRPGLLVEFDLVAADFLRAEWAWRRTGQQQRRDREVACAHRLPPLLGGAGGPSMSRDGVAGAAVDAA
jgi:hypothetical protein